MAEAGFVLLLLLQERYERYGERLIIISKVRSREWPPITHGNNLEEWKRGMNRDQEDSEVGVYVVGREYLKT